MDASFTFPQPPKGRIRFTFSGGPRDGQEISANSEFDVENLQGAHVFWAVTYGGEIGRKVRTLSPGFAAAMVNADSVTAEDGSVVMAGVGVPQTHVYEVVANVPDDAGATVRCEYRGDTGADDAPAITL